MSYFAVSWTYTHESSLVDEVRPAHRQYIAQLREAGHIHAAGPWDDATGGLLIFNAPDAGAVFALLAADPMVARGVVVGLEVRHWNVIFTAV
jgi:uncharacterized protein YciI